MLEGPIGTILYLIIAAFVARKAMRYYMTSTVWRCHRGYDQIACQVERTHSQCSIHHECGLVERGEVEPRDGTAVRYAAVVASFWPFWIIVYAVSTWIRNAPMTKSEKLRLAKEQEHELLKHEKEIEALEAKIKKYQN